MKHIAFISTIAFCAASFFTTTSSHAQGPDNIRLATIEYQQKRMPQQQQIRTSNTSNARRQVVETPRLLPGTKKTACHFQFSAIADQRPNQKTVGSFGNQSLNLEGVDLWLASAKTDLWDNRLINEESGPVIQVSPIMTRLYSYNYTMNIHGVIALKVDFIHDNQVISSRRYRGFSAKANAWGALGEHLDVMTSAAHDGLPKLMDDLNDICQQAQTLQI